MKHVKKKCSFLYVGTLQQLRSGPNSGGGTSFVSGPYIGGGANFRSRRDGGEGQVLALFKLNILPTHVNYNTLWIP
jgi:hypothetical protein